MPRIRQQEIRRRRKRRIERLRARGLLRKPVKTSPTSEAGSAA